MGILFGLVNQILLAALAIGLLCVIVLGLPDVVAAPPHPRRPGPRPGSRLRAVPGGTSIP